MVSAVSLLPIAYLCCGLLPLVLVPSIRSAGAKPGRTGLLVTLGGLSLWSVSIGLLYVVELPALYPGLATLFGLGSQLAAVGYFLMAAEYTGTLESTRRVLGGVAVIVVAVQLLSITDPLHHLVWAGSTGPPTADAAIGPLGVAIGLLTAIVGGAALCLLVVDTVTASGVRRNQSFALVAAGIPTMIFFLADALVLADAPYPILPFGFVGSAFAYAWALFRMEFLDIVPVGRKHIVEEMSDAAVVLDANDRVVECNPAARRLVGAGPEYAGMPVDQFFGRVFDATDWVRRDGSVDTEITVTADGDRRHFHLQTSRLGDSRTVATGRLIVLRDITPLKRREQALERRESELEFLRQVLTRVLRHNIRNDLTVVRGYASAIADDADRPVATIADELVETSDELLETGQQARAIEQVIDRTESETLDLARIGRSLVEDSRSAYPDATVSFAGPDSCVVDADPLLESALEILLETVLEHDSGSQRTVEVGIERAEDRVIVRLVDRDSSISAAELGVIERGDETALEGTNGSGPWIVHWIINRSAALITSETDGDEIRLSISIPTDDSAVDGEHRD